MRIACLGDSLTEGDYGVFGKCGIPNVHSENYPYFLSLLMQCEVKNYGKCGFRSTGVLKLYENGEIDVTDCDKVLIMLGSNGGQEAEGDSEENAAYLRLIDCIRRDAPRAEIILITPPNATKDPSYSNCGYMGQVEQAQKFTRRAAKERGLRFIDLASDVYLTPKNEYIFQNADGLHFTYLGYCKIAEIVWRFLRPEREMPLKTIPLNSKIPLVAHRGLSGLECENTAAAFIAAGNRAYYGIETDVWRTKDGRFICCHDPNTACVAEKSLGIEKTDFDELRALRCRDYDGKTYLAQLRLPTPEEYVRVCKKYGKQCIFELKSAFTEGEAEQLVRIFRDAGWLEHTTFISTSLQNLRFVRKFAPGCSCQMLHGFWDITPDWVDWVSEELTENRMDLDVDWYCVTKEAVDRLHEKGIRVNCWTVDNPALAEYLINCGVDYITTNILENA